MKKLLILFLLISLNVSAAEKKTSDDIDHMGLAALLLKDGFSDRANDELDQVDTEDESLDKGRYFTLRGLVSTKLGDYKEANLFFEQALAFEDVDKALYLYIAQNSYKLKDYKGALIAIGNAGPIADEKASFVSFKSERLIS